MRFYVYYIKYIKNYTIVEARLCLQSKYNHEEGFLHYNVALQYDLTFVFKQVVYYVKSLNACNV